MLTLTKDGLERNDEISKNDMKYKIVTRDGLEFESDDCLHEVLGADNTKILMKTCELRSGDPLIVKLDEFPEKKIFNTKTSPSS